MPQILPVTTQEAAQRGWDAVDFVCITGDAYVECYVTTSEVDGEASGYRPYRIDGTDLIEFPADVITVDIGEFEKLEGCVTCLSVRLRGV